MSPLWWMAFVSLGVLVSYLVMVAIDTLAQADIIRRINARVRDEHEANPLGGAKVWNGKVRR
jgi:hypothetical protein